MPLTAHVLTVGAELLAGDILDTNARDLGRALAGLGIAVTRHVSLPDDVARIASEVTEAKTLADLVLVTGGLGPTPDDLTREGVARAFGVPLSYRPELHAVLEAKYLSYGNRTMPRENLVQITLPDGCQVIPNPLGTAPGFLLEDPEAVVFVVPGIPREMAGMLEHSIVPWLRANRPVRALLSRTVRTMGIGESELIARHGAFLESLEGIDVAFYPQQPGEDIKLTARSRDAVIAERALDLAEGAVRERLGSLVYARGGVPMAGVVGELLVARGWSIGVAESCTGGALAAALVEIPGASRYLDRGLVTYSNRAKTELLGVEETLLRDHGAVSEEVARAMAEGLRERAGVDLALSTTGIAGPDGATAGKPVGLVFSAIAAPDGTRVWRSLYPGPRDLVIRRAVAADLNRLRRVLLGER